MRAATLVRVAALSGMFTASVALGVPTYNAANDFSTSSNPNGVWSFGSRATLASAFVLYASNASGGGIDYWGPSPVFGSLPGAFHNAGATTNLSYGTAVIEAGQLMLHPGAVGEYSVARFVAPTTGTYTFNADFIGQDQVIGTTTDVHLLKNGASLFSDTVGSFHDLAASGTFTMTLLAGDTLDAAVGFGSNGHYFGDSTGLDFVVDFVPLPTGAALGLAGLMGLSCVRRRGR